MEGSNSIPDSFMARWQRGKAGKSWLRHAAEKAKNGDKERAAGGGSRTDTAANGGRNEVIARLARYRFD